MAEADEKKLVRKAQRGDHGAFRILMERYKRKVYAIAYGMVRNPEAAMDISQEVFLKVFRYLQGFQGDSSFYTWLYRITVNLTIDHIRKHGKRSMLDFDDGIRRRDPDGFEALVVPSQTGMNPAQVLARRELVEHIGKAFDSLGEKHRSVLMLREIEGLSYEEIAQTLKINKGTVMSRLHHARKNFQAVLKGYLTPEGEPGDAKSDEDEDPKQNQKEPAQSKASLHG